jgi:hypothetical protein
MKVKLTFTPGPTQEDNVVVGYKLDSPPTFDGEDGGAAEWGSDTHSRVVLSNIRGGDNNIGTEVTPVRMRAGYDDKYIYFLVMWREEKLETETDTFIVTPNLYPDRWEYNDPDWMQRGSEDQFFMYWRISGVESWEDMGAAVLYHDADSTVYLEEPGIIDVWNWRAARTGLTGYIDDWVIEYDSSLMLVQLHPDQGNGPYVANLSETANIPKWMHRLDPNYEALPPFEMYDTRAFDDDPSPSWDDGAKILGYVSVQPTGGRADITCCSDAWSRDLKDWWTVEFRRLRNTGHGDDFQF